MRPMHYFAAIVAACVLFATLFATPSPAYAQPPDRDGTLIVEAIPPFDGSLDMGAAPGAQWTGQNGSGFNLRPSGMTIEFWAEIPPDYQGSTDVLRKPGAYEVALASRNGSVTLCFIGVCDGAAPSLLTPGWHHIAFSYSVSNGGDFQYVNRAYFVDGQRVLFNSSTPPSLPVSLLPIEVGQGAPLQLDELRISKSLRYGAEPFVPPAGPFGCDDDTLALWHFDEGPNAPVYANACGTPESLTRAYEVAVPLLANEVAAQLATSP